MIEIVLAGRPVGKERVKRGAAGNAYTPERTVRFEDRFSLAAQAAMAGRPLYEGALAVDVVVVLPVSATKAKSRAFRDAAAAGGALATVKPDWDNLAKCLDAMNLIVWRDDAQIVLGQVLKVYGDRPMMAVRVTPVAREPALPAWAAKHTAEEALFG